MSQPTITAVAGPPGSGKTTWIRQQLAAETSPALYLCPGTGNVPIDQTCIAAEFPQIKTLTDGEESDLAKHLEYGVSAYIAYEAVLADIKRLRIRVDELYILGDLVGPTPECEKLVQRVRSPKRGEIAPQICIGWWEEQCFNLHGVGSSPDAAELRQKYGADTIKLLWDSVSRKSVEWLRSLTFGFHEFDCLLIHGSTVGASDELTPETPPPVMLDRALRADANTLFCGRSGLAFEYQLQPSIINNWVQTLDSQEPPATVSATARRTIGVGNVGRKPGVATYALYNPDSDRVQFKTVHYGAKKGFQP